MKLNVALFLLFLSAKVLAAQALPSAAAVSDPVHEWERQFRCGKEYFDQRKLEESENCFRRALSASDQVSGDKILHGKTLKSLGAVLLDRGRIAAAGEAALAAVDAFRECGVERCGPGLADAVHSLAIVYNNQGRLYEAERLLREALELYTRTGAPEAEVANALGALGWVELSRDRPASAEAYFQRALSRLDKVDGVDHRRGRIYGGLSKALLGLQRNSEAVEAAQLGLAAVSSGRENSPTDIVNLACTLAEASLERGDFALAEESLLRAEEILPASAELERAERGMLLSDLAYLRFRQNRLEESAQFLDRAIRNLAGYLSDDNPQMLKLKINHAKLLRKLKRGKEARIVEQDVRSARKRAVADPGSAHKISVSDLRAQQR